MREAAVMPNTKRTQRLRGVRADPSAELLAPGTEFTLACQGRTLSAAFLTQV